MEMQAKQVGRFTRLPQTALVGWLLFSVFFLLSFSLQSQCTLICNDNVNVTLGPDGYAVVTPDLVLENVNVQCPGPKLINVIYNNNPIGDTVSCDQLGLTLDVEVVDIATNMATTCAITVEDKTGPVISCRDTVVLCGVDTENFDMPSIVDNCDPNPIFWSTDNYMDLTCTGGPYNAVIARSWYARDNMNNLANSCVQRIYLKTPSINEVVFPPNYDGIDNPVFDCSTPTVDSTVTGVPMIDSVPITAACKFQIWHEDSYLDICENSFKIIRLWTVLDCCTGEDTSAYQIIKVMDTTPPMISCQDTIRVGTLPDMCSVSYNMPSATVSDDCSSPQNITVRIFYPGGSLVGNGGVVPNLGQGFHTIVYEATDDCGNRNTCETVVEVVDNDPPVPVCVEFLTVNINSTGMGCIPATSFDAGSYDNCALDTILVKRMGEPDSLFRDRVCFFCQDVGQAIMIIVRYIDEAGNINECMTEVKPQDKIPPRILCPDDVTILCTQDYQDLILTGIAFPTDNCGIDTVFFADDTSGLSMCGTGPVIRTWTALDLSGLTVSCTQEITIVDTTASVFTPVADITLFCPVDLDTLTTGVPTVIADCEQWGRSEKDSLFTNGCTQKLFRTYTFYEWCSGRDTSFTQEITIIDNAPPVWQSPTNMLDTMLQCAGQVVTLIPQAVDNCSSFNVMEVLNDSIPGNCPNDYQLLKAYLAEDACGNISDTFFVSVTVRDTTAPIFLDFPRDTFIECGDTFTVPILMAEDNCGAQFTSNAPVVDTIPGICPVIETYRYRWIVVDDCNNRDTAFWNVELRDITAPTALPIPDSTYACLDDVPGPDTAVVMGETDNCGGPVMVTYLRDEIQNTCEDTLFRFYAIADQCGNEVAIVQRYFIADRLPPRVQSCPGTRIDTITTDPGVCEAFIDNLMATYLDNCSGPIDVTNDSPFADDPDSDDASGTYPLGNHVFRFYGVDTCGNVNDLCIVNLTVTEIEPPTLDCVQGDINLPLDATGNAILDSAMVVQSAPVDDCSTVELMIVPNSFNCDSLLAGAIKQVFVFATDTFGNVSTCGPLNVVLSDPNGVCNSPFGPPGNLGGSVKTSNGNVLKNTMLYLSGDQISSLMVNSDGYYEFDGLEAGDDVSIQAINDDNPLNGVTTFDIVLAAKHILGKKRLESPEAMIAADVNRSGSITVTDIVELRKMILGKQVGFSNNHSWRTWDADFVFSDPTNPFLDTLPESIDLNNLAHSFFDLDFVAVKVGDINGDFHLDPITEPLGNRSTAKLNVRYEFNEEGESLVSFHLPEGIPVSGVQFAFEYEKDYLELREVLPTSGVDVDEHFNLEDYQSGKVQFSWNGDGKQGEELFRLRFRPLQEALPEYFVQLNTEALHAELYTEDLLTYDLTLHQLGEFSEKRSKMYLQVLQNEPNPFHDRTRIELDAKQLMEVEMEVFNVAGKVMIKKQIQLSEGRQTVEIDGNRLSGSGVYGCRFTTPHGIQTIKMIYVE
jgi:hypothetical protein